MNVQNPNSSTFWSILITQVFVLFSAYFIVLEPNVSAKTLGNETDHLALLEFKKNIINNHQHIVLSSWNGSTFFCSWHGITCGRRHDRVIAMNLEGFNLHGSISPYIGNLSFLKFINLENNSFYGQIPPQVGKLFRLQHLNLTNNTLVGEIPTQLANCSKLSVIKFDGNKLVGKIPTMLCSLKKLVMFQLDTNNLSGKIPLSIGNLSSLVHFSFKFNNLEGSIPNEIENLKSLSYFAASDNKLSGIVPNSLYNISTLTTISIAHNKLNGCLPLDIGLTLPNLEWFAISLNEFSGLIPYSFPNASKLQLLELARNNFVGEVPSNLGHIPSLTWLSFNGNYLGDNSTKDLGFLASLTNCTQLHSLNFGDNNFGGILPTSIANLTSDLHFLFYNDNYLYGTIGDTLKRYTKLHLLNLGGNLFHGTIPSYFGTFQSMEGLSLSRNRFFGPIPTSIGNFTQLVQLYLYGNMFNGTIPPTIRNCKNLQYLDISRNFLTGIIPKELTALPSLTVLLNLSHNSLSGNLPVEMGNLKSLNTLDISANNLTSEIPRTIGDCISLEYLNLRGNFLLGSIPSTFGSLKGLTYLDLSQNDLSGNIPKELENLSFLMYLNLSFNELEGEVPKKGVFGNVTSISLMENGKLCGGAKELKLPNCSTNPAKKRISQAIKIAIVISCLILSLILLLSFIMLYKQRRLKKKSPSRANQLDQDQYHFPRVTYDMLYKASEGFSNNNLIGLGSFGSVYKGHLYQLGIVAIKVLNLQEKSASKSFLTECMALRGVRHRNLVKIITCCSSLDHQGNEFKALVFKYMENASLEEWLHSEIEGRNHLKLFLSVVQRLNVAIDIASGLHYLHCECDPPIIHCDIKPSNVLLDNDMVAHVSDFGLAKLLETTIAPSQSQTSTIGLKGTIGYAAPEYGMGVDASLQGDVYSFGILLLEMFTGKRPTEHIFIDNLNIHQYVKTALPERLMQIMDPTILATTEMPTEANRCENQRHLNANVEECLQYIFKIGLACSVESPKERMDIVQVTRELQSVRNALLNSGPGDRITSQ